MDNIDKLEYVLALAEERNLTRTAQKLYISQPALTNYINRLEKELGVKLFDRTTQPVSITQAGSIYIQEMKKIQSRQIALKEKLRILEQKERIFRVGVPHIRGSYILPEVICCFMDRHPKLSVQIENELEDVLEKELAQGQLDLIIGVLSTAHPGVRYEHLGKDQVLLLIPRSFPCVSGLVAAEGTIDHPCLIESGQLTGNRLLLSKTGGGQYLSSMLLIEKYGIVADSTVWCGSLYTLYKMVANGVGMLFTTPKPFAEVFPQLTKKIAFCTLQKEPVYQNTYVGYYEDNTNVELIKEFIQLLRERGGF